MAESKEKAAVDWSRFGLNSEERKTDQRSNTTKEDASTASGNPNVKELFDEDQVSLPNFSFISKKYLGDVTSFV